MPRIESGWKHHYPYELGSIVEPLWVSVASCVKWGRRGAYCRSLRGLNADAYKAFSQVSLLQTETFKLVFS